MHGKEFESRIREATPATTIGNNKSVELSLAERQDLILFSATPACSAIYKLLEKILVEARDEAVRIPSGQREERLAALDTAHAAGQIIIKLKQEVRYMVDEHLGRLKQDEQQRDLEDRAEIENIIFAPENLGY